RIEPMMHIARSLRTHRPLLLNWFRARGTIALGAVEGLNNKLKVVTRRAYGFRSFRKAEVALYHALGALPEPDSAHRFGGGAKISLVSRSEPMFPWGASTAIRNSG
ncbi:MAG: hypothetical protein RJA49_1364, partial [Actinomycetota bacterium]